LFLVVGIYILLPQIKVFHHSLSLLMHVSIAWAAVALVFSGLTFVSAAANYYFLAIKPLKFAKEIVVQLSVMFVNRLLPAGSGGISTNYLYLKRNGHSKLQAAAVTGINNLLGIVGHLIILGLTIVIVGGHVMSLHLPRISSMERLIALAVLVIVAILMLSAWVKVRKFIRQLGKQLSIYKRRPGKILAALLSSMSLTLFNVGCLWASAVSTGLHPSFVSLLIIFSLGTGVGTITPTPGGLGGFEAGLVAGFVAFHYSSAEALAAVLLFRLVSYWIPLVVGAVTFSYAEKSGWFTA
jgi:uncharacterized membrane protein YbhN (UPF0104 family)